MRNTQNGNITPKGYLDEDDRTTLDPEKVRAGVEREMAFMGELGVGETVQGRDWCGQRAGVTSGKGDAVRSRFVVQQFRNGTCPRVQAATSGPAAERILLPFSAIYSLFAATAATSVGFMHANDRKSVCGTSNGGKLAQRNGLAGTTSTQRFAMRGGRFPGILGEPALRRRVEAEHDGSVHLQQRRKMA